MEAAAATTARDTGRTAHAAIKLRNCCYIASLDFILLVILVKHYANLIISAQTSLPGL